MATSVLIKLKIQSLHWISQSALQSKKENSFKDALFRSKTSTMKPVRVAVGAAFSPSVFQHNNIIISSSSNIPSLCHADE